MDRPEILVIDGQGGKLGNQLIAALRSRLPDAVIRAVGTNSAATAGMMKAQPDQAATGENAVVVACRRADIVAGPVGIVVADSMLGEVTGRMAAAVARAGEARVLIPFNRCETIVAGVADRPLSELVDLAAERERVAKEMEKARNGLRITEGKLSNEKFVAHAPENVVNAEREKVTKYQELIAKLEASAKSLEG